VLTLSIIHNPAFIVAAAFWAATLVPQRGARLVQAGRHEG